MVIEKSSTTWNWTGKVDSPSLFKLSTLNLEPANFQVLRAQLQFGEFQMILDNAEIPLLQPNCSSALNTWKLAGLKFKVEKLEKLEKRWDVYFFPQIPSSWRLFNHHTRPSVFCILCKRPFGEMVQFRLKREKTTCTKFFAFASLKLLNKVGSIIL